MSLGLHSPGLRYWVFTCCLLKPFSSTVPRARISTGSTAALACHFLSSFSFSFWYFSSLSSSYHMYHCSSTSMTPTCKQQCWGRYCEDEALPHNNWVVIWGISVKLNCKQPRLCLQKKKKKHCFRNILLHFSDDTFTRGYKLYAFFFPLQMLVY